MPRWSRTEPRVFRPSASLPLPPQKTSASHRGARAGATEDLTPDSSSCLVRMRGLGRTSLALPQHHALRIRDAELEALSYATRQQDEALCCRLRTDIVRGLREQSQPPVKVLGVDRQRKMPSHGLAMIAATHQRDG